MEDQNELLKLRREKLNLWRAAGQDPFGQAFPEAFPLASILNNFAEEKITRVAGRIVSFRDMGKSLFAHIQDQTGKIQVYVNKQSLGEPALDLFKQLDLGDFIGGEGPLFTTKTGEKTVKLTTFTLLSKSLRPIPSAWFGLSDVEQRYRQRYLDLILSPETREVFAKRSAIVRSLRNFLESRGFIEVETPMMQVIAGGAAATPFTTHHQALDLPLFLRIAPELYLKRLLVAGYPKVFEINRNFRNEGISRKHNPEFTMLEAYWAFADFEQMASLVEEMITSICQEVNGTLELEKVNLTRPWARKKYRDCVTEVAGADWFTLTPEQRRERAQGLGLEILPELVDFEVTNQVFEKLVEAKTMNPLFVTHLPQELVPLAKQNVADPSVVDVYELIINGQEISPGYSELNDPLVQRQRLEEQAGAETQKLDEDFLQALEYGMPPAGGIGLGIDRLTILLTGVDSIRDVILFPLLRPQT
jgi:lysyl-tRNA synthetase, class II